MDAQSFPCTVTSPPAVYYTLRLVIIGRKLKEFILFQITFIKNKNPSLKNVFF
jgi:hypothetical protein